MRNGVMASLLVVAILASAGAGYLLGETNARTVTSTATSLAVSTTTEISTVSTSATVVESTSVPFIYLTASASCTATGGYVPCFGGPAYVFNACPNLLAGPAAPFTCTYSVTSAWGYPSYTVNITLELRGASTEPQWANCSWTTAAQTGYASCMPVINETDFIVGEPAPPHT